MKKRIANIITAVSLCLTLLPMMAWAAETTHTVTSQEEFEAALRDASAGDTISISGSVTLYESGQDALVIDKAVTIQGDSHSSILVVRYSGIILGADVTFDNITLQFPSRSRNAIMANGHTLTLNNVARDPGGQQIHLFCGGMTGYTQENLPTQGLHGQIIIRGNTSLGNLYAGSISADGEANSFDKPATITIENPATGTLGSIYASGALETPAGNDCFDPAEVAPPTPSVTAPLAFRVTGDVTIQLYENKVLRVDGATGGDRNAAVVFRGARNRTDNVVLTNIAALTMESGYLVPGAGSSFSGTDASVSVPKDTTLGLNNYGNITIGDFTGGGDLFLANDQTLTITGAVSGATKVGVGDINPATGQSSGTVTAGHTYIQAASFNQGDFTLAPPSSDPSLVLAYDEVYGTWTTVSTGSDQILVERFTLTDAAVASNADYVDLPLNPTFAANSMPSSYMDYIPLEITVNGVTAMCVKGENNYYSYTGNGLSLEVIGNKLYIMPAEDSLDGLSGEYNITVTVPGEYSASGTALTSSTTLTVAQEGEETITIPIPRAIPGLRYTGSEQIGVPEGVGYTITGNKETDVGTYTATVSLTNPYTSKWSDNTTNDQTISWSIGKAAGPAAPTGLGAAAPSASGGSDGKITGTTNKMEFDTDLGFANAKTCGAGQTTGLTAGTYYVRVIITDTENYEMGEAATVVIPEAVTVSSIAVNSTAHKTSYTVGDALDVSGLSILVTMSDGSTRTVVVTADMVSGFTSEREGRLTLTVNYKGRTATYAAVVKAPAVCLVTVAASPTAGGSVSGGGTFHKNASVTVTAAPNSGYRFVRWEENGAEVSTSAEYSFTVTADCALTAVFEEDAAISGDSGSGSGISTYAVTVEDAAHGTVKADHTGAVSGATVTITVTPDEGYWLNALTVTDAKNNELKLTDKGNGKYTFTMPASKVTVEAIFAGINTEHICPSLAFADLNTSAWYHEAVDFVLANGLMSGYPGNVFGPNDTLSRAMLAQILYNLEDQPAASGDSGFTDVADSAWYADAAAWAGANGIVTGYPGNIFSPNDPITREQMATMLYRYAQYKGMAAVTLAENLTQFTDADKIGGYAVQAMNWAVSTGVVGGYEDNTLRPQNTAARAEAAQMLKNFLDNTDK